MDNSIERVQWDFLFVGKHEKYPSLQKEKVSDALF